MASFADPNAGRWARQDLTPQSSIADEIAVDAFFGPQGQDVSGTDTQALGTDETGVLATAIPATDTQGLGTDESGALATAIPATDTQGIGSSDSGSVSIVNAVSGSDTQGIGSAETGALATAMPATDTQAFATDETAVVAVAIAATDTQGIGTGESGVRTPPDAPVSWQPGRFAFPNAGRFTRATVTAQSGPVDELAVREVFGYNASQSLGASETQAFGSSEVATGRNLDQFSDAFNDDVVNTNGEWVNTVADPDVPITESGAALRITPTNGLAGTNISTLISTQAFKLTGSSGTIEVIQAPIAANAESSLTLRSTTQADHALQFRTANTILQARKRVAGVDILVASVTYNATNHRWWRISESGGTVTWATSPDGSSWTTLTTDATGQVQTLAVTVEIAAGTTGATTTGPMTVGGFNAAAESVSSVSGSDTQAFGSAETGDLHAYITLTAPVFGTVPFGSLLFGESGDTQILGSAESGALTIQVPATDTQAFGTSETAFPTRADTIADDQAIGSSESASVLAPVTPVVDSDTQAFGSDETAFVTVNIFDNDDTLLGSDEGYDLVSPTLVYGDDETILITDEDFLAQEHHAGDDTQAIGSSESILQLVPIFGFDTAAVGSDEVVAIPTALVYLFDVTGIHSTEALGRSVAGEDWTQAQWARGGFIERPDPFAGGLASRPDLVTAALAERAEPVNGGMTERPLLVIANLRDRPDLTDGTLHERPPNVAGSMKER